VGGKGGTVSKPCKQEQLQDPLIKDAKKKQKSPQESGKKSRRKVGEKRTKAWRIPFGEDEGKDFVQQNREGGRKTPGGGV